METNLPSKQIQSVAQIIERNISILEKGSALAIEHLKNVQEMEINSEEDKAEAIDTLAKIKGVYDKIQVARMEATKPIDEIKSWLMSFERPIDPDGKDNEYSRAKANVNRYDQKVLDAKKKAELEAEMARKVNVYKAELKAAVGRSLTEMMAGQKKNAIQKMAAWEQKVTLENYDEMVNKINNPPAAALKQEDYDKCFHTNFKHSYLLNDELTKEYIESLKKDYPFEPFNNDYKAIVAEIFNEYKEKMPSIKIKLEEIKGNKEKEEARQKQLQEEALKQTQAVDDQAKEALKDIDSQKDMATVEAEFIRQGTLADVEAGPSKKKASFADDSKWLVPLQQVIGHVATNGVNIKNAKGEYIPAVQWWLGKFETLGKEVPGIKLTELAKTIVKSKE